MTSAPPQAVPKGLNMTHGQVLRALSGLLLGMFVTMIANTLVSTSLPQIVSDLHGTQTSYTWVVTGTLLATTISTPIWGKLSDITNRKVLLQVSLIVFVLASAAAGFSESPTTLIACRVFQGLGAGGMQALSQIVMADILSPRERGRYMGLFGGVMAVATVGGPLIGGWITDTFSWHWNFYLSLPFAIVAVIMLQKTLHLPPVDKTKKTSIDYLGIVLLSGGIALLLIWVSLAGNQTSVDAGSAQFTWASVQTLWMLVGSAVLLAAFIFDQLKAKDPLLDLHLFKNRTFTLSTVGSIAVGVAMFGCTVYLSQLMIMSRGASPSMAGLMTIPMMAGMLVISTLVGAIITRTGVWKPYMIFGSALLVAAMLLIGSTHYDTNYWLLATYMFLMGSGVGMIMQNLTLVVQNAVSPAQIGVATSTVSFFRTMGGTIGVSWLGAQLANKIPSLLGDRSDDLSAAMGTLAKQDPATAKSFSDAIANNQIPNPADMPDILRPIFESVYGDGIAHLFTVAAPIAVVTLLCVIFLPNLSLSHQTRSERQADQDAAANTGAVLVSGNAFTDTATGAVPVVHAADAAQDGAAAETRRGGVATVEAEHDDATDHGKHEAPVEPDAEPAVNPDEHGKHADAPEAPVAEPRPEEDGDEHHGRHV